MTLSEAEKALRAKNKLREAEIKKEEKIAKTKASEDLKEIKACITLKVTNNDFNNAKDERQKHVGAYIHYPFEFINGTEKTDVGLFLYSI